MAKRMVVGIGLLELWIGGSLSLKDKRSALNRVLGRTRNAFNISIAEVGENDHLRRARIGFALAGNDRRYINGKADKVVAFVESIGVAEVVGRHVEIVSISEWADPPPVEEEKYDAL